MRTFRKPRALVLALVVVGLAMGVAKLATTPMPRNQVSVGLVVWPPYEFPFLARSLGRLPPDIRLVEYRTPTEALRAYRDGTLDVVALTSHFALYLAEEDPDTRVILVVNASAGGDALVARPELESIASLRGRRIAYEPGVFGEYMLARVLREAKLSHDDVERVPLSLDRHQETYAAGKVDALVTYEPQRTFLVEAGARVLFESSNMEDTIYDVLLVRRPFLDAHEPELRSLVRAWSEAVDHYRAKPLESAIHMAPREHLSPEAFQKAMAGTVTFDRRENRSLFQPGSDFRRALHAQGDVMARSGLLRQVAMPAETLLDPRALGD